ncbi:MAG: hypothetical protein QOD71_1723 [Thermoleophilaceae bacterium]|nr:hypothetical protein [Thermoleophilaceae bacterium]
MPWWRAELDGQAELLGCGGHAWARLATTAGRLGRSMATLAAAGELLRRLCSAHVAPQPPGRGGRGRREAGRSTRDDAADRSTAGDGIAGASQLRSALRSGGEDTRVA